MVRNKAPIRYTTQSGVVGSWVDGAVAGGGGTGGETGAGGSGIVGITGSGTGDTITGGAVVGIDGVGTESVVKAPTALQHRHLPRQRHSIEITA